jgi:hypothetical protein
MTGGAGKATGYWKFTGTKDTAGLGGKKILWKISAFSALDATYFRVPSLFCTLRVGI